MKCYKHFSLKILFKKLLIIDMYLFNDPFVKYSIFFLKFKAVFFFFLTKVN